MTVLRPLEIVNLPSREAMNAILAFALPMYFNQLEPSCIRHWILGCRPYSGKSCLLSFPRKDLSFGFLPLSLPLCFILQCVFSRATQKAISKSTVRTVIALAIRKQGQSYTFESSTTLFVPCVCFYICFQTFLNKLHTILRDNSGISLNLQAVYLKHLFSNFQIICSRRKIIYTFHLFGGKTERNEVSKRKH